MPLNVADRLRYLLQLAAARATGAAGEVATAAALARAVRVTKAAVSMWMSGASRPSSSNLEAAVLALGSTMADFYALEEPKVRAALAAAAAEAAGEDDAEAAAE